jgi:hypothetical protein
MFYHSHSETAELESVFPGKEQIVRKRAAQYSSFRVIVSFSADTWDANPYREMCF